MIDAGLEALARLIPAWSDPEAPLMPELTEVAVVSTAVAEAVALAAVEAGVARHASTAEQALACLERARWHHPYRAVVGA
jgi:malate dehydrogenase (oxaloacetate-decarboxylating)